MTDDQEPWDAPEYTCPECMKLFRPTAKQSYFRKTGRVRLSYCAPACRAQHHGRQLRVSVPAGVKGKRGPVAPDPCHQCGCRFRSYSNKSYCSFQCYRVSAVFKARTREQINQVNARQRAAAGADDPTCPTVTTTCPACSKETVRPFGKRDRRFCSKVCKRQFFADRFDRWIANPESIALPRNYDEFLTRDELPCLVAGCDWVGRNLGIHANHAHGITADRLKELAGFNKGTGLVTPELSRHLAERPCLTDPNRVASFVVNRPDPTTLGNRAGRQPRLEAKEHWQKVNALKVATHEAADKPARECRHCGGPVPQPAIGARYYCNDTCRNRYYHDRHFHRAVAVLSCSHCGKEFMGNRAQQLKAAAGRNVACTQGCAARCKKATGGGA